jgi:3,4-dihydroxy 2-butanone 4-phosphate synthase/GTP cyclohydrolase II
MDLLLNQSKYRLLVDAIDYLKQNSGVLLFINNPEQHVGSVKEYGVGAQILKSLGVGHMRLISNTLKEKDLVGLSGFGLDVAEIIHLND